MEWPRNTTTTRRIEERLKQAQAATATNTTEFHDPECVELTTITNDTTTITEKASTALTAKHAKNPLQPDATSLVQPEHVWQVALVTTKDANASDGVYYASNDTHNVPKTPDMPQEQHRPTNTAPAQNMTTNSCQNIHSGSWGEQGEPRGRKEDDPKTKTRQEHVPSRTDNHRQCRCI
jgi:hypothetical protein